MQSRIYCGDCIEIMRKFNDECVDLIITSPPYNLGNVHHTGSKRHQSYDDSMSEDAYQKWQIEFLGECFRVLKGNGSLWYNHKNRIKDGKQITPYEWLLKTDFVIKQEIVWVNRSQNFDKIRFYPFTERLYWLAKSSKTKMINTINHSDVFDWREWKPVGTGGQHTRAFPEQMVEDILSCFPDAKVVMDPFAGSGTTAVVARRMGMECISIEKNKDFCHLMMGRI